MKAKTEKELIMLTKQYIEKLTEVERGKYPRLRVLPVKVKFSNRMTRCICQTKESRSCGRAIGIEFIWSNKFLNEFHGNLKLVKAVFYHELAHAIVGADHAHDKVWEAVANKLGGFTTRSISLRDYREDKKKG